MPTDKSREGRDFRRLRSLGFEFDAPQDEFSYQPDSGGSIGGQIGAQEYGIKAVPDAEDRSEELRMQPRSAKRAGRLIPRNAETILNELQRMSSKTAMEATDSDIKGLVRERLGRHPQLKYAKLEVEVSRREVTVRGEVPSDAQKLRVTEILEALPEVQFIHNELSVAGG